MGLCIDLVLTLRQPFYPAARRLKFYLLGSFFLALFISITSIEKSRETCLSPNYASKSTVQNISLISVLTLYIIIAVFSIFYAAKMLNRPGISPEIRQMFMKKHVLYAISFIVIWFFTLVNAYYEVFMDDDNSPDSLMMIEKGYKATYIPFPMGFRHKVWVSLNDEDKNYMNLEPLQILSFVSSISTGLIMGVIRCLEPYFAFVLRRTIKAIYGIPLSEDEIDKNNSKLTDTIAQFLNSSLNIELVHIILKGITTFGGQTRIPEGDYKYFIPLDNHFDDKKDFKMDEIEIKDPSKWNLLGAGEMKRSVRKTNQYNELEESNKEQDDDVLVIEEEIKVVELAPKIFSLIRNKDNITYEHMKESLSPEFNRDSVFKAGEGQGKSGSFFFFSHDRRFIIKTMNDEEYETFQGIFKKYFRHVQSTKTESLIARIYGVFTVYRKRLQPVHLILMANTVNLRGKHLRFMFDLKGSLINRESKMKKNHDPGATLKDVNLLEVKKKENILKFTPEDKAQIMEMIKRDVPILTSGNIMDYSLLLAIEENPHYRKHAETTRRLSQLKNLQPPSLGEKSKSALPGDKSNFEIELEKDDPRAEFAKDRHAYLSSNMQFIYHISIIDYLQDYNLDKKMENFVKTIWRGRGSEISAVPPQRYAKRYIEFMDSVVVVADRRRLSSMNSGGETLNKIREEEDYKSEQIEW